MTGISLKTGEVETVRIPLGRGGSGAATGSTGDKGIDARVDKIMDGFNGLEQKLYDDVADSGPAAVYSKRLDALREIKIPKGMLPIKNEAYRDLTLQIQKDFFAQNPGVIPVAGLRGIEKAGMWPIEYFTANYYAKESQWNPLLVDGTATITVNGKPMSLWYKESLDRVGEHIWYRQDGVPMTKLFGSRPDSEITLKGVTPAPGVQEPASPVVRGKSQVAYANAPREVALLAGRDPAGLSMGTRGLIKDAENWHSLGEEQKQALLRKIRTMAGSDSFLAGLFEVGKAFVGQAGQHSK